jgi:hypothetical protein
MLTKLLAGALLVAAATTANAATDVTFATFGPVDTTANVSFSAGVLSSSSVVDFKYLIPELLPLGHLSATLTLEAVQTGYGLAFNAIPTATFDGVFSYTYNGPDGIFSGVNMHTGDNLLSGIFTQAVFQGLGSSGSIFGSTSGITNVSYNSYFLEFDPLADQGFSIGITSITPALIFGATALANFTGVAAGNFSATVTGVNYHNDVPEPESWALMVAGFGILGMAMRRSRRTLTVVTA